MNARLVMHQLHESATPREWRMVEPEHTKHPTLWAGDEQLATFYGPKARENIDLVLRIRNVLPEHLRSLDTSAWYLEYYRTRIRIFDPSDQDARCPNCDKHMGGSYFSEFHYVAPGGHWTCNPIDWRARALTAEAALAARMELDGNDRNET